jgi:Zn-dependent protease with chaperone function
VEDFYPPGPQAVPADLTRPTGAYKQRAWLALASLALFVALYLELAGWFVWTAYRMLGEAVAGGPDTLWNYLIGASAAFLAVFMLKALVFLKRGGAPSAIEATPAEQPGLHRFLNRLADEAGAPRPRRVYLSARVNAAVFYDLSILNLIFPSRKSLEIGLALVNVLTLSEIKAVLAHEFGHFAQRSMAIGSWVYIAQQIASHIVAKRDKLDRFLQTLSNIDLRIAWVGWLLSLIVWSIRSLMDTLLRLVVLAQRALSRQMEFQADLVAVSLTGSDELIHALHKLHAADEAWGRTLGFASAEVNQGRVPHDLFAVQARIIEKTAGILNDESYGRVPPAVEKPEARRVFKSNFAQPPQMWSTHPANADREQNAKKRYLSAPHDARSAWVLFADVFAVKSKVTAQLLGETKAQPATAEQTFRALDERFSRLQYAPRYRGAYLGRPLARHAARADELHEALPQAADLHRALGTLYPAQLADDLEKLRDLVEERAALEALRDKVYQATGDRIVHRGREISRRELPAALRKVVQEEEKVRERITTHDRRCRSVHLAAAARLGGGWKEYLTGLIAALHYAEHTLANLRDAQGLFGNVLAVVTAGGGKVSRRRLQRLIATANVLHAVLAEIHAQKATLQLDHALCARLKVKAWAEMLEELRLPPAAKENINDWVRVIDGWVGSAAGALSALADAALERLLEAEDEVARCLREGKPPPAAEAPTRLPPAYATLLPGKERKRQKRLGLWDRFQTADGVVPALARLLVAGAIVGAVLGFSSIAGTTSVLTVYNGLGVPIRVAAGKGALAVQPFSSNRIEVQLDETSTVEARTAGGELIEAFTPPLSGHAQRYVYNVAGASPLVEWTAAYGSAKAGPPRFIGAPRWMTSDADVLFANPPESVRTKGGGATRTVLSGIGDLAPGEVLKVLGSEGERRRVIALHAKWDHPKAPHTQEWQGMAAP